MHGEPWGGVLAAGAHVRTVRMCRILASHVAHLAGQILHEGGRVEQSKLGRRHLADAPTKRFVDTRCRAIRHRRHEPRTWAFLAAVFLERLPVESSASSWRRAAFSEARASCSTVGYRGSISTRALAITAAATSRVNHLLSAGITYQGAHFVLVLLSTYENADW